VILGLHYPTDVAAGAVLGGVLAAISLLGLRLAALLPFAELQ
jgi:membrane-associated phospholipid phosphatase